MTGTPLEIVRDWVDLRRDEAEIRAELARAIRGSDPLLRDSLEKAHREVVRRRKAAEALLREIGMDHRPTAPGGSPEPSAPRHRQSGDP